MSCVLALMVPCAMAQTPEEDRRREYNRQQEQQREEQQRRAQEEMQRQQKSAEDASKRQQQLHDETTKNIEDWRKDASKRGAATSNQVGNDMRDARPKLPAERNVLLGSWRVESGSQGAGVTGFGQGKGIDRNAIARELSTALSNPCVLMFGNRITFAPSTYSIQALDGSVFRGSVDYRSTQKQVISAVTQETWKTLSFEIEGPNRIVWGRFGCALVRVGAPANAAVNAPTAPGNVRTAAASSSAPSAAPLPQVASAAPSVGAVFDGAAFQCADGSLLHVSLCQGASADSTCKLTELHKPPHGLQMGTSTRRADIAARVKGCEAGGIRYGADHKAIFVR